MIELVRLSTGIKVICMWTWVVTVIHTGGNRSSDRNGEIIPARQTGRQKVRVEMEVGWWISDETLRQFMCNCLIFLKSI